MARSVEGASATLVYAQKLGLSAVAVEVSAKSIATADLVLSLVPKGAFVELWHEIASHASRPKGWLFDVGYSPWPSVPAISWGSQRVISGLEMLIWQATEQVEIFSRSLGVETVLDRSELYSVMKAAVSGK
jgi:shikimate 5-dehydrogenase